MGPNPDPQFYVSLNPYWWPCNALPPNCTMKNGTVCNTSNGEPYIDCDGQRNPEMHEYDHDGLINATTAVIDLGIAYYFTGNETYASKAASILRTYWINNKTAPYPSMDYGHYTPGVSDGQHGCIIDTHFFPEMLDAVALLAGSPSWPNSDNNALMSWFGQFGNWLLTSTFGQQESNATNNHGVWYDVQTSAVLLHSGNFAAAKTIAVNAGPQRVGVQIMPDGELPAEEARTKSWSYTEFCTDAFTHLASLTPNSGIELFDYISSTQSSIRGTLEWQIPYINGSEVWPDEQIVPFLPQDGCVETEIDQCLCTYRQGLRRAANHFSSSYYESLVKYVIGDPNAYQSDRINLLIPQKMNTY
jgi:hypothetical protein